MKCRHCKEKRANRPRGLCWTCFADVAIRNSYPQFQPARYRNPEPTAEEIERLVADGYANLPEWWDDAKRRQDANLD